MGPVHWFPASPPPEINKDSLHQMLNADSGGHDESLKSREGAATRKSARKAGQTVVRGVPRVMGPVPWCPASPPPGNNNDPEHQLLRADSSGHHESLISGEGAPTRKSARKARQPGAPWLKSFTNAVFCVLAATAKSAAAGAHVRGEAIQLAEIEKSFGTPREPQDPTYIEPIWFEAWKLVLHNQIDGLLSAIALRPAELSTGPRTDKSPTPRHEFVSQFKVAMVGDSTMRMQARALSWLFLQRDELTCSKGRSKSPIDITCSRAGSNGVYSGDPSAIPEITISIQYIKSLSGCQAEDVDADFVYFGCGLRLLQLIPDREETAGALETWVHYERLLEEAVLNYRSGGGRRRSRVPVGVAFMTTHSFADEVLDGAYKVRVREYMEQVESLLNTCRDTVADIEQVHPEWESEYEPEDICTRGTFDESGVLDLNRRAEPIMGRLGVPMVRAYDITHGQLWATRPEDGRHYPAMVPVELNSFLSEVTTALRMEKRQSSGGGVSGDEV